MQEIWQSATGLSILLGPALDITDGVTPEPGVDLATADSAIVLKHGVSASLAIVSATWTHVESGWYALAATSTMFDTLGQVTIRIHDVNLCLPFWKDLMVISTANWNYKYASTGMAITIASVSGSVYQIASSVWGKVSYQPSSTVGDYTIASVTGSVRAFASTIWGKAAYIPSATVENWTIASVSNFSNWTISSVSGSIWQMASSVMGKTNYLPSASMASVMWEAATANYAVAGSFGEALGDLAAGADPWAATVTAYTGTNTYGLILGGIPSATTLASVVDGIAGKTVYIPSATVENWTVASVSNFANWTIASVSGSIWQMASSIYGKTAYIPSATVENWTIASVSNSVNFNPGTIASVSNFANWTIASVSGSIWGMASSNFGKISYLPSMTVGSWSISGVASVSIGGTMASLSGSIWQMASSIYGKTSYIPSATVENWTIASVSNSVWMTEMTGNITGNLIGTLASVSSSVLVRSISTGGVTASSFAAGAIEAAAFAAGAIDAGALSADAVDEILDEVIEGTTTVRHALKLLMSFVASKVSGGGTATITFRDVGDTKNRIVMTVDADGNRSAVVLDPA